jgi:hypothetical protein
MIYKENLGRKTGYKLWKFFLYKLNQLRATIVFLW